MSRCRSGRLRQRAAGVRAGNTRGRCAGVGDVGRGERALRGGVQGGVRVSWGGVGRCGGGACVDRLGSWVQRNLMRFRKGKGRVLPLTWGQGCLPGAVSEGLDVPMAEGTPLGGISRLPFPWQDVARGSGPGASGLAWARRDVSVRPFPTVFLAVQGHGDSGDSGSCHCLPVPILAGCRLQAWCVCPCQVGDPGGLRFPQWPVPARPRWAAPVTWGFVPPSPAHTRTKKKKLEVENRELRGFGRVSVVQRVLVWGAVAGRGGVGPAGTGGGDRAGPRWCGGTCHLAGLNKEGRLDPTLCGRCCGLGCGAVSWRGMAVWGQQGWRGSLPRRPGLPRA